MTQTTALSTRIAHLEALALPLPELRSVLDVLNAFELQQLVQATLRPLQICIARSVVRWSIDAHGRCHVRTNRTLTVSCPHYLQSVDHFLHGERFWCPFSREVGCKIQNLSAAGHTDILSQTRKHLQ